METLSIKIHEATRDAIEGLRVTGGRIVSASAVGRRLIEQALAMNGGAPIVLPALDFEPDDLETVRYALEHDEKIHASRSRALLEFYDEVCAMLGQHPVPSYKVNREGYAPPVEPPTPVPIAQVVPFRGAVSR